MLTPSEQLHELESREQALKPVFYRLEKLEALSRFPDGSKSCLFGILGFVSFVLIVLIIVGIFDRRIVPAWYVLFFYGGFFCSYWIGALYEYLFIEILRRIYKISKTKQKELTELQRDLKLQREAIEKTIKEDEKRSYRERENLFIEKLNTFVEFAQPFKITKGMMPLARKVIESLEEENIKIKTFGYQVHSSDYYNNRFEKLSHFLKTETDTSGPNSEVLSEKTTSEILTPLPTNTPKPENAQPPIDNDNFSIEQNISELFPIRSDNTPKKVRAPQFRIAPKQDYNILNARKDTIGHLGEKFVYEEEKRKLRDKGLIELSENVKWVSQETDSYGYDIISFNEDGSKKHIEVKTTTGDIHTPFYLTDVELATLKNMDTYIIVRVYDFKTDSRKGSKYTVTKSQLELYYVLEPLSYKVNPKY